jgi:benzylsuccinate CoA-transferase BbsF subunit
MSGLVVLSFGQGLAGNVCAMTLAELGAEVIKIESPRRFDSARRRLLPDHDRIVEPSGAETSALFGGVARSVRSLTLNMASDHGRGIFRDLVPRADVVLENLRPGVLAQWGCSYDALRAVNRQIILLSLSGFGATGPRHSYSSYGGTISAFIGMTYRSGAANGAHHDYVAASHSALAILAATAYRDRTGEGTYLDVAQIETGAALMGPAYLDVLQNQRPGTFTEDVERGTSLLREVVACKGDEAWLAIEIETPAQWRRLSELIGATTPPPDRQWGRAERDQVRSMIEKFTAALTPYQAFTRMRQLGLPVGVVQRGEDLYRDPHLRARTAIVEVDHPDLGRIEYPAPPHRLSRSRASIRGPAPRLGQHTQQILEEYLGYTRDTIEQLRREGIV